MGRPPFPHYLEVGVSVGGSFVGLGFFGIDFLVDLSPGQLFLPAMAEQLHRSLGKDGWTILPIEARSTA